MSVETITCIHRHFNMSKTDRLACFDQISTFSKSMSNFLYLGHFANIHQFSNSQRGSSEVTSLQELNKNNDNLLFPKPIGTAIILSTLLKLIQLASSIKKAQGQTKTGIFNISLHYNKTPPRQRKQLLEQFVNINWP